MYFIQEGMVLEQSENSIHGTISCIDHPIHVQTTLYMYMHRAMQYQLHVCTCTVYISVSLVILCSQHGHLTGEVVHHHTPILTHHLTTCITSPLHHHNKASVVYTRGDSPEWNSCNSDSSAWIRDLYMKIHVYSTLAI